MDNDTDKIEPDRAASEEHDPPAYIGSGRGAVHAAFEAGAKELVRSGLAKDFTQYSLTLRDELTGDERSHHWYQRRAPDLPWPAPFGPAHIDVMFEDIRRKLGPDPHGKAEKMAKSPAHSVHPLRELLGEDVIAELQAEYTADLFDAYTRTKPLSATTVTEVRRASYERLLRQLPEEERLRWRAGTMRTNGSRWWSKWLDRHWRTKDLVARLRHTRRAE